MLQKSISLTAQVVWKTLKNIYMWEFQKKKSVTNRFFLETKEGDIVDSIRWSNYTPLKMPPLLRIKNRKSFFWKWTTERKQDQRDDRSDSSFTKGGPFLIFWKNKEKGKIIIFYPKKKKKSACFSWWWWWRCYRIIGQRTCTQRMEQEEDGGARRIQSVTESRIKEMADLIEPDSSFWFF